MNNMVKEPLCQTCNHKNVCVHKDDYLNMIKNLQDIFFKVPADKRDFMYLRDPDCRLYL